MQIGECEWSPETMRMHSRGHALPAVLTLNSNKGRRIMKKALIAIAVLATLSNAAFAQNNVTIYGVVDAGINIDKQAAGKTWALQSGQQSGSRLGVKGKEKIGGGLSTIFALESGFAIDDGSLLLGGRLFGRQAWIGLDGSFGVVKLGRQYSAIYTALSEVDPFGLLQAGDMQRVFGYGLGKVDPISRSNNTISYTTANLSGFTAQVGYKFGETASFNAGSSKFAGLAYSRGSINLQLAYQNTNGVALGAAATQLGSIVASTGLGSATASVKNAFFGGTYDFGAAKAHFGFGDTKAEAAGDARIRNYMMGVSAPAGRAGRVIASWNRNDVRDIENGKSNQYAIGYSYALSKRTNLYTSAGFTRNDSGVRLNALAAGDTDRQVQAGIRHTF
jgi:predicted porin